MIESGAVLNGRYRLAREIARGGMAVVWEAEDLALGRRVAVKTLHPQFTADPEFLERFRREARAAASLAHPNVVSVYDVGEDQQTAAPFLVMELVEGESLKDRIRRVGALPDRDIREIGSAVAAALDYAHRRGLVHRDVKPQNVLLGQDGRVHLADFGIAQALAASGLTRTGAVMGSVHYLAPELARGKPASPAADVYSLGAVLYEMATGRVPFTADTELAVALAHAEQPPVPPRTINPRLAPDLEQTVLRAMAKNPGDRFPSAGELARALAAPSMAQATSRLAASAAAAPAAIAAYAAARRGARAPARPAPPSARPPARSRVAPQPGRWSGGGFVALLLLLAVILLALGAGFFGLASLSRDGGSTPAAPTAAPTSTPGRPSPTLPAAVPSPATPTPSPTPTAAPSPTPEPPTPTPTPRPPTSTPTPRPIQVPNVVGKTMNEALATLRSAGLTASVKGVNVNAEQGRVVATSPEAGAPLPPGGTVLVEVATGQVVVPNVIGQPRDAALKQLADAGLKPTAREVASDRPRGTVVALKPPAGETVPRGYAVEVSISRGG